MKHTGQAPKYTLFLLAGGLWLCVGIMLVSLAVSWLISCADSNRYIFGIAGIVLALIIHHFGFLKIVNSNLKRIAQMQESHSIFSFMPWKSYLLIPVMMAIGIILRHSALPRKELATVYTAIGLALMLSSVRYLRHFVRETTTRSST